MQDNNNNPPFYMLFLQTGPYSPLQSKEHKQTQAHAHMHTVNRTAWRGEISKMIQKIWASLMT